MTQLGIFRCTDCDHVFNPREPRWGRAGTSRGPQKCAQCAKAHNAQAGVLRALLWMWTAPPD